METDKDMDPSEVNKSPEVIKAAQEDLGKLHILVCGRCHKVFHFIEQFQQHQEPGECTEVVSPLRNSYENEPKPQVWGFMLWKNAQAKQDGDAAQLTTWSNYQDWCKLEPEQKDAWMKAGQNLLSFSRINAAKIQEIKNKVQAALKSGRSVTKPVTPRNTSRNIKEDEESLEEGEICLSQLSKAQKMAVKAQVAANKTYAGSSDNEDVEKAKKISEPHKKAPLKPVQISNDNTTVSITKRPPELCKAFRTTKNDGKEETTVEKIINRRFNQKKKCFEYFVKWDGLNESECTWEPKIHFNKSKTFIEEFDKSFNKVKLTPKLPPKKPINEQIEIEKTPGGRPQRTSKQRALNQVKVWCGDITEEEDSTGKRKFLSDDEDGDESSDSFEKKIKLEEDTDTSDDDKPSVTIKRIVKTPNSVNGVAKKTTDSGHNLSPQRVVRVTQKQLPNLSSGVYIMSKTEGILKLDSNTSSASPIFKVGPKIGDTHIKMVKRAEVLNVRAPLKPGSKPLRTYDAKTTAVNKAGAPPPQRKIIGSAVKQPLVKSGNVSQSNDKSTSSWQEEDSDGLEELDFPTDLPVAPPESPPGEFTLCPLTGKMLGQSNDSEQHKTEPGDENITTLDNLVKLAVADLPDEDFKMKKTETGADATKKIIKTENSSNPSELKANLATTTSTTGLEAVKPATVVKSANQEVSTVVVKSNTGGKVVGTSILNAALTTTKAVPPPPLVKTASPQRRLLSAPNMVRQKITTITRLPAPTRSPASVPSPSTTIIHKLTPNKTRAVAPKPTTSSSSSEPVLKRSPHVTTYKPAAHITRRIGNTTIYKTVERPVVAKTTTTTTTTTPTSTAKHVVPQQQQQQAATVINMPLLTTEEPPSTPNITLNETETVSGDTALADLSTFGLAGSETPLLITGEDGTIYQVAGQNEDGQTILISEGPDGQQQCVIVSSENPLEETQALLMDTSETETVAQSQQPMALGAGEHEADAESSEESQQVVAQIIKADPPSPGGTRKVVLMLPDGNLMMTDVTAEQYAALELDK